MRLGSGMGCPVVVRIILLIGFRGDFSLIYPSMSLPDMLAARQWRRFINDYSAKSAGQDFCSAFSAARSLALM